jgi:hypothetical protein
MTMNLRPKAVPAGIAGLVCLLFGVFIVGVLTPVPQSRARGKSTVRARPAAKPVGRVPGHRNLFNGDCTFLFGDGFMTDPKGRYQKKTLHWFIDMLADNGVDTYLANPNAQVPWYPSKRLPHILTGYRRGDREFVRGHMNPKLTKKQLERRMDQEVQLLNRYLDLAEDGVDWLKEIAKACRRRKVSPWLSIRMNDMHGANSWERSYLNCALQKDPRYRLRGREVNPRDGINPKLQALNYARPEVRDYMFRMIRELVEDYDFEGLELDWLRCPFCIDPPARQADIELMTRWVAQVRALTRKRSARTGKPYPLGLRIPCRLGLLKAVGLDVKALADAGLIDFVGLSNGWQTSWDVPYDELRRELGPRVALFGVIEDAPNWMFATDDAGKRPSYRLLSASPELLRGNAAGKLAAGADGIEQFNFFCTDEGAHNPEANKRQACYPALRKLENLGFLRGKPKHYALASMQGYYMFPLFEQAEQVPAVLEPDWKRAFRLSMCAEPAGRDLEVVVQLVVERTLQVPDLGVSFNGCWPTFAREETNRLLFPTGIYTRHLDSHRAFNYRFKASGVREGWNEILVINGSHKRATLAERRENAATLVSVEVAVRPRPAHR